jgi:hypothetical protein
LIDAGAGSAAMQQLPWAAVPTVLVPMCLVMHATIYMQLRRARRARVGATRSVPRTSLAGIETVA